MPDRDIDYLYWNERASNFDDDDLYIIGETTDREVRMWLMEQFMRSDTVCDMGCGTGFHSRQIANRVKKLICIDMSGEMIELAGERFSGSSNVEIYREDCYDTSLSDESVDAVLLVNVVHVVLEPLEVLKESHRILKPAGRIVVVDYTSHGLTPDEKKQMMRRYMSRWGKIPEHSFAATPENLAGLMSCAGFDLRESTLIGEGSKAACLAGVKIT